MPSRRARCGWHWLCQCLHAIHKPEQQQFAPGIAPNRFALRPQGRAARSWARQGSAVRLGGVHLKPGGFSYARRLMQGAGFARRAVPNSITDAKQLRLGTQEHASSGNGGRGTTAFAQRIARQHFELPTGSQHNDFPLLINTIQLVTDSDR